MQTDWESREDTRALEPNEIHLWWVDLSLPETEKAVLRDCLTEDERNRGSNFRESLTKSQFELSRGALRCVLSEYLDEKPTRIQITTTKQGKPQLVEDRGLSFNLAHAGEHAIIAVGNLKKIGVDLEVLSWERDIDSLARRVFSQLELEEYLSVAVDKRLETFYNGWTRKEAFLKAIGIGIGASLREFAVNMTPGRQPRLVWIKGRPIEPRFWTIRHLERPSMMVGALAVRQVNITLKEFDFRIT